MVNTQFYVNQFDTSTNALTATVFSTSTDADLSDNDVSANITMAIQVKASALSKMFFYFTDHFITSSSDFGIDTNFVDSSYVRHFINPAPLVKTDLVVRQISDTVGNNSDVYYLQTEDITEDAKITDASSVEILFNPRFGLVTTNTFRNDTAKIKDSTNTAEVARGDTLSKDFLRSIANSLFKTHLGVDLFNNEDAFTTDFHAKCDVAAATVSSTFKDFDAVTGSGNGNSFFVNQLNFDDDWATNNISNLGFTSYTGGDGSFKGFKDEDIPENITRRLLLSLLNNDPGRFSDISANSFFDANNAPITLNNGQFFKVPFEAGDTVCYKFTVNPDPSQNTIFDSSGCGPRSYKVVVEAIADS